MNLKKSLYVVLGLIFFAVGTAGIIIPVLPTFIFYAEAAFFFGRSSEKLNAWFTGSSFYKENVSPIFEKKGVTEKARRNLIVNITLVIALGLYFSRRIVWMKWVLLTVWICHVLFFLFGLKRVSEEPEKV